MYVLLEAHLAQLLEELVAVNAAVACKTTSCDASRPSGKWAGGSGVGDCAVAVERAQLLRRDLLVAVLVEGLEDAIPHNLRPVL